MRYLTPVRIDETKRKNKERHARSMQLAGLRGEFTAKTPEDKIKAKKMIVRGQQKASRAHWGALAAKEKAVSRDTREPAWKRQIGNSMSDWAKEKGKKSKAIEKRVSDSIVPLTMDSLMEGKYKDQREAGKVRGPIAQAAMKKLRGSKGKMVGGKLKPATSKAARESYKRAARAAAGTSKPPKAPEDRLPYPRGGDAGSTEANIRSAGDRR